jgi:uncharacterized metal-binding protein YceD (DUF177 family)
MISLDIVGLREGNLPFTIETTAQDIPRLPEEFTGPITVQGVLQKLGRRYSIDATATGTAHFTCDRSLEEFDEELEEDCEEELEEDCDDRLKEEDEVELLVSPA